MDEVARIEAVLAGIRRVRAREAGPLSQGLSAANARRCLDGASEAITAEGLRAELKTPGRRPTSVVVIVAAGVFTSPLEWVAMLAAAGCRVWLKPPSADPEFCAALAADFLAEGLPVEVLPGRSIPEEAEVILAFGSDETVGALAAAHPGRRVVGYGHRFSAALVSSEMEATALATDHALYDTRGCMAPVAVFALGDPTALAESMAVAMAATEIALPRGNFDPALGPLWRERLGLARARGQVHAGEGWAVLTLPPAHFLPAALPRMVVIHPVDSVEQVAALLSPWRTHLSSCATNLPVEIAHSLGFPRVCLPGELQIPPFPRRHDGQPMLGSLMLAKEQHSSAHLLSG